MLRGNRVGVVIPAFNESLAIGRVINDIPAWVDDIVVADNASTDNTRDVAEAAGARVVFERERGYGAACKRGLRALHPVDIVVFLDADYSDFPGEMQDLVEPIVSETADLVIGSRVIGTAEPGALQPQQRFGNWLACHLIRSFYSVRYTDLGPFRAIRKTSLDRLDMRDKAFGWTVEMQIKAAQRGLRTMEIPVSYRRRIGVSKISGTVRGSVFAGVTILLVIVRSIRHAPKRVAPQETV